MIDANNSNLAANAVFCFYSKKTFYSYINDNQTFPKYYSSIYPSRIKLNNINSIQM